jgi:glycosyltransferase involved in cell wall biosynthesis
MNHAVTLKNIELDIIHAQTPFTLGWIAMRQAKKKNIPIIHTYHTLFTEYVHYLPFSKGIGLWLTKRGSRDYCNRCDGVVVPSSAIAEELRSYGVKKPIEVIPTGVNAELVKKGNAHLIREQQHLAPEAEILLYAGRLAREKNVEFVVQAFKEIAQVRRNAQLVIVGDGPQRKYLENLVQNLKLEHRVTFTGFLQKEVLASWYKAADVFLFASTTETQGMVVLEAMEMGTPVVAVNAMGVKDVVGDNIGGFSSTLNIQEFTAHALKLLENDDLRQRKSMEAVKKAEKFSTTEMAQKMINFYSQMILESKDKTK